MLLEDAFSVPWQAPRYHQAYCFAAIQADINDGEKPESSVFLPNTCLASGIDTSKKNGFKRLTGARCKYLLVNLYCHSAALWVSPRYFKYRYPFLAKTGGAPWFSLTPPYKFDSFETGLTPEAEQHTEQIDCKTYHEQQLKHVNNCHRSTPAPSAIPFARSIHSIYCIFTPTPNIVQSTVFLLQFQILAYLTSGG